jgi:hypothetical protein
MPSTEELLARRKISNRVAMNAFRKWRKEKKEAGKRLEMEDSTEKEEGRGKIKWAESCAGGAERVMSGEDGPVEEGEEGMDEACECKV